MDAAFPRELVSCIEQFLEHDDQRPSGENFYQEVFDSELFFPLQRQRELAAMIQIARKINPRIIMEIGADKGGSIYHWAKCIQTVHTIIACEIRGFPYAKAFEKAFRGIQFIWEDQHSFSQLTANRIRRKIFDQPIDVLFIDGDKLRFEDDFNRYLPLMRKDGIVFMHDIQDKVPREAYDRVCARGYRHEEIIDTRDSQIAMDSKEPFFTPHESWLRLWNGKSAGVGVIFLGDK